MFANKQQYKLLKTLVFLLEFLTIALLAYLIFFPYYPKLKYQISSKQYDPGVFKDPEQVKQQVAKIRQDNTLDNAQVFVIQQPVSDHRLIITKIGVNAPIIESASESALNYGSWHWPDSSTPDLGGNTIITGHRFKYLPPNNLTFYLFDKLELDDLVTVVWEGQEYYYQIHRIKVVDEHDLSILEPSDKPILTLFTCHPIFSTNQRLVVIADLITNQ